MEPRRSNDQPDGELESKGLWLRLRAWRHARKIRKQAERELYELFSKPTVMKTSSLRLDQRARAKLARVHEVDGQLSFLEFTILRHPRPYPFSKQFHEVMELYRFELSTQSLTRLKGLNLSRKKGRDGEPGSGSF